MGESKKHQPVLLTMTIFSRYLDAIGWAEQELSQRFGEIGLNSEVLQFEQTKYYEQQMGADLLLKLIAFKELVEPEVLPETKLWTNELEKRYLEMAGKSEARPLNLDPGYMTLGKFVLASTKDNSHRIYLGKGVFGEVTLYYAQGGWREREWTYPNYRLCDYQRFLSVCRSALAAQLHTA